jgi:hypothetical protein
MPFNGRKSFARARQGRYRHLVCPAAERPLDRSKSRGPGRTVATGVPRTHTPPREAAKLIIGYQPIIDIAALSRLINVLAEIILER